MKFAQQGGQIANRLERGDLIQPRFQRRGACLFHSRFVHTGVEIVADFCRDLATVGYRLRSFFQNAPQKALVVFRKLGVDIPAGLIRWNRILLDPAATGVVIEVGARIDAGIDRTDLEVRLNEICLRDIRLQRL